MFVQYCSLNLNVESLAGLLASFFRRLSGAAIVRLHFSGAGRQSVECGLSGWGRGHSGSEPRSADHGLKHDLGGRLEKDQSLPSGLCPLPQFSILIHTTPCSSTPNLNFPFEKTFAHSTHFGILPGVLHAWF